MRSLPSWKTSESGTAEQALDAALLLAPVMGLLVAFFSLASLACNDERRLAQPALLPFFNQAASNDAILAHVATNLILAGYADLQTDLEALRDAVEAYEASPTQANLAAARAGWLNARARWNAVEQFFYGPIKNAFLDNFLDSWAHGLKPCNTTVQCSNSVDATIAGSDTLSLSYVRNLGDIQRGLPAVEYLLYDDGSGANDLASVQAALTGRRLSYLVYATQDMVLVAEELKLGWDPSGLNFAGELITAGRGSGTYATEVKGLSQIITGILEITNMVKDSKIGFPAGFTVKSGGSTNLTDSDYPSPYSENSFNDIIEVMNSVRTVYTGTYGAVTGPGIATLVLRNRPDLDETIRAHLDSIESRAATLRDTYGTLPAAITNDSSAVRELYDEVGTLLGILSSDLISSTGTKPTVSPTDGD